MAYQWALLSDPSVWLIVVLASSIIYHANTRTRPSRSSSNSSSSSPSIVSIAEEETHEPIGLCKVLIMPVAGSLMLIGLFYFLSILKYLLVVFISLSALSSTSYVIYPFCFHILESAPNSIKYRTFSLPAFMQRCLGISLLPTAIPLSISLSLGLIILWLTTSNWIVVNLLAIALAISAIASLQLPNLMIVTILLIIFWAYDGFWVFISPLIFPKNVMETVAISISSLDLPLLIKIPRFLPSLEVMSSSYTLPHFFDIFQQFEFTQSLLWSPGFLMLGLGDIVLPGLALNTFYRRDFMIREDDEVSGIPPQRFGYYPIAKAGYIFGLIWTFLMLILLKRGQPALIWIVPSILIPTYIVAWRRGQLGWLWKSVERYPSDPNTSTQIDNELGLDSNSIELVPLDEEITEENLSLLKSVDVDDQENRLLPV